MTHCLERPTPDARIRRAAPLVQGLVYSRIVHLYRVSFSRPLIEPSQKEPGTATCSPITLLTFTSGLAKFVMAGRLLRGRRALALGLAHAAGAGSKV